MTETEWSKKIVMPYLQRSGAEVYNAQRGSAYSSVSVLDLHVTHEMWTGWLELKGFKTLITTTQYLFMQRRFVISPGSVLVARMPGPHPVNDRARIESPTGASIMFFNGETCENLLEALRDAKNYLVDCPVWKLQSMSRRTN
jgi:hypothetical protein